LTQTATAPVPDERLDNLAAIYVPKKITRAALTIVDTPGLSRSHEENAARLGLIREAGCLVMLVAAFQGADPRRELQSFEEDLLWADLAIVTGRMERLRQSLAKPRPTREQDKAELERIEPLAGHLETGRPLREFPMSPDQAAAIKSFQLLTEKPRLVVVNQADELPAGEIDVGEPRAALAFSVRLQLDLESLNPAEREAFCHEMGVAPFAKERLIRELVRASQQIVFFTAGDKEVRSWLIRAGATAEDAAASVHTDLARHFVRAERMTCADLFRLGSEREVKAHHLMHKEPRSYVVQEGDILYILAGG
jgi:hypothetical protein